MPELFTQIRICTDESVNYNREITLKMIIWGHQKRGHTG